MLERYQYPCSLLPPGACTQSCISANQENSKRFNLLSPPHQNVNKSQVRTLFGVTALRWDYNIPGMVDAAKSLADLQAKGLIKQVGLTNMNVEAVSSIVYAGVPVANNQVGTPAVLQDSWHWLKQPCSVGKQGLLRRL